ncbi:MAG: hypothetical protein BA861_11850 [Desulfobacterales bacterium S3730MH5]|nr:MAG: hypothetical protein BA861_11850 [Desulfobacterales bacterium S3730MH5]
MLRREQQDNYSLRLSFFNNKDEFGHSQPMPDPIASFFSRLSVGYAFITMNQSGGAIIIGVLIIASPGMQSGF